MRVVDFILCVTVVAAASRVSDAAEVQAIPSGLSGLPSNFMLQNEPAKWGVKDGILALAAGKNTDWFVWPGGGYAADTAPRLVFKTAADFVLDTKVEVKSGATYDAGCIVLYETASVWAKLCLEAQADRRLDVISVVTRGVSDDVTSFAVDGTSIHLKIAKADGVIFFYASEDGIAWSIVRKFRLETDGGLLAGFSAQSPDGKGASALFSDPRYLARKVNLWELR